MATFLHRIGRTAFRRRWLVVLLWALVLGAVGVAAANGSGPQTTNVTLPGTEAQRANDLLEKQFPAANADGANARVVLRAPGGEKIDSADNRAALKATLADVQKSSAHIAKVSDPFAAKAVSATGTTAYSQVTYSVPDTELTDRDHSGLDKALESGRDRGLTVEASGNALRPPEESHTAEVIGFALAAVILLITFGSLVAAGLPLPDRADYAVAGVPADTGFATKPELAVAMLERALARVAALETRLQALEGRQTPVPQDGDTSAQEGSQG